MATPFVISTEYQHPPCTKSMQISKEYCDSESIYIGHSHSKEETQSDYIISIRTEHGRLYSQDHVKARRRNQHFRVRELPRLGFWYVKSSIRYILRRTRALYKDLISCDNSEDPTPRVLGAHQVMGVGPYFSFPVIHPPNAYMHSCSNTLIM